MKSLASNSKEDIEVAMYKLESKINKVSVDVAQMNKKVEIILNRVSSLEESV